MITVTMIDLKKEASEIIKGVTQAKNSTWWGDIEELVKDGLRKHTLF